MNEFWNWWQHLPEHISPVLFQIGPLKVQYYGLMYIVAFGVTYLLVQLRLKREKGHVVSPNQVQSLFTAMIIGLLVGARLGYVLFYNYAYYLSHPLEIVLPFDFSHGMTYVGIAGMSFHGGLIGVVVGFWIQTRREKLAFFQAGDLIVPAIPAGYTFGRLGNFINGELYGRVTLKPWGMIFPTAPTNALRHPSQLYESFGEGILLFGILWFLRKRVPISGAMLAFYLIGYGAIRFVIEYFRQPDAHIGFVFLRFSMGQLLCAMMILAGIILFILLKHRQPPA